MSKIFSVNWTVPLDNPNLTGLILILALNSDQFSMEPCIANEKPECARHKRPVADNVVGKSQRLDHLKACAFNRKGKSKNDIKERPTAWTSPYLCGHLIPDFQVIFDSNNFLSSFTFCSATIAARTASNGDSIGRICNTAKNRRLVLPSIGDDHA